MENSTEGKGKQRNSYELKEKCNGKDEV